MQVKVWRSLLKERDVFYNGVDIFGANCNTSEIKILYTNFVFSKRESVTPGCVFPTVFTTAHKHF